MEITASPLQVPVPTFLADPFPCFKKKKKADLKLLQGAPLFPKWMLMPAFFDSGGKKSV